MQSNLDYPNPFGQGEISNRSDNVDHAQATPTKFIMHVKMYMTDLSSILTLFNNIRTRFDSSAAAGSRVATTRRRFTAYAQASHIVTMCTLILHFLCISSLDNRGSDN